MRRSGALEVLHCEATLLHTWWVGWVLLVELPAGKEGEEARNTMPLFSVDITHFTSIVGQKLTRRSLCVLGVQGTER